MNARLAARAAGLGLTVLLVIDAIAFIVAMATSNDVRIPGATTTVDEVPGESLSASFEIQPVEALVVWLVLTAAICALLWWSGHRRQRP